MILVHRADQYFNKGSPGIKRDIIFGESFPSKEKGINIDALVSFSLIALEPGKALEPVSAKGVETFGYVIRGELSHKNGLSSKEVLIRPGQAYVLSSGEGILLHEKNASSHKPVVYLHIQLQPENEKAPSRFEVGSFEFETGEGKDHLVPVASCTGDDGALRIGQNCFIYVAKLSSHKKTHDVLPPKRVGFLYLIQGSLKIGRTKLERHDAAAIVDQEDIRFSAQNDCYFLYMDLPPTAKR